MSFVLTSDCNGRRVNGANRLLISSRTASGGMVAGKSIALLVPFGVIGSTTVTFDGVDVGSEIHAYLPDGPEGSAGTEVAGVESCTANQELTWPVYSAGSPNNTVFITITKRGLVWQKFPYTSKVGAQILPIFQMPDLGYNNPP